MLSSEWILSGFFNRLFPELSRCRCGCYGRKARGLVRWSANDLAREAQLGLATIRRAEQSEDHTSMTAANDLAVRHALEAAGVEFIDENGGGAGVRLRKQVREKQKK
jgi:hypothetical protein